MISLILMILRILSQTGGSGTQTCTCTSMKCLHSRIFIDLQGNRTYALKGQVS